MIMLITDVVLRIQISDNQQQCLHLNDSSDCRLGYAPSQGEATFTDTSLTVASPWLNVRTNFGLNLEDKNCHHHTTYHHTTHNLSPSHNSHNLSLSHNLQLVTITQLTKLFDMWSCFLSFFFFFFLFQHWIISKQDWFVLICFCYV